MITFEDHNGLPSEIDPDTVTLVIASSDLNFTTIYYRADERQYRRCLVRGELVAVRVALGLSERINEGVFSNPREPEPEPEPEPALYIQQKT